MCGLRSHQSAAFVGFVTVTVTDTWQVQHACYVQSQLAAAGYS
jgi:hypothetical protein